VSQISQHISKINKQVRITKVLLEKGLVVDAIYRSRPEKGGPGRVKRYMMIILNPGAGRYTHALSMEHFSYAAVKGFAKEIGTVNSPRLQGVKKLDIGKLLIEGNTKQFYNKIIKKNLGDNRFNGSYRTFITNAFVSLKAIDYDFGVKNLSE